MKVKKSLLLMAAVSITVTLAACSKDKNKSAGADPNSEKGTVTEKAFSEKYQFELNGCNTDKHEFSSDSQADVSKQLCEALQNEELNRNCAQPLRKNFFDKKCPSVAWSPVYPEPADTSSPSVPAPDKDLAKEREIREILKYILVDSYEVKDDLTADVSTFANTLSSDMKSCGFSYVGPKCLSYHALAGSYEGTFFDPKGESVFLTDLRFNGIDSNILFAFKIKDESGISSDEVKLYIKSQEKEAGQSIKDYLVSPNVQLISTMKIIGDFTATAKERVQSPSSLKELYHMAHQLNELNIRSSNPDSSLSPLLVKSFLENKAMFGSGEEDYQYRAYSLAESLGAEPNDLMSISEVLLSSDSESVKQFAATEILSRDSSRKELKSLVVSALDHNRWTTRLKAIQAVISSEPTTSEQNAVLLKMNDNVREVREAALAATSSINLNDNHIQTLESLTNSQHWTTRQSSATLLAKVSGKKATDLLIGKMSDNVREVREEVYNQLNGRTISENSLDTLGEQLNSQHWTVRRDTAKLIGKSQSQKATDLLIGKMSDNVRKVREEIVAQLSNKALNEKSLSGLENQSTSQHWTVRRDVAILISKISGDRAVVVLIKMLSDNVREVREKAVELLNSKTMKEAFVTSLKAQLEGQHWTSRRETARLMGKIKTDSSLDILIARLQVENVPEVKEVISAAIAAIRN